MSKEYSIVNRSSGLWVTDGEGTIEGPFDTNEQANDCKKTLEKKLVEYDGWKAELIDKVLEVTKNGITRQYDIKQKNDGIEYDKSMPEYFIIRTKNFYYNFKFEVEDFFVGDKIDNKTNELIDTFASWDVNND